MITAIIIISLGFGWLLIETDFMRVRLPVGKAAKPKYARYKAYNILRKGKPTWYDKPIYEGNNYPEGYSPNGEPEYTVILNPGIDNVLCGWQWLDQHCASMVDYQPRLDMAIGGVRYNMVIKQPAIIKDIMKANKLTKKQRLAYA